MDLCLGLGLGDTMVTLVQKMGLAGGGLIESDADSRRGSNFSWSFVTRSSVTHPYRNAIDSFTSSSQSSRDSEFDSRTCSSSSVSVGSDSSEPAGNDSGSFTKSPAKSSSPRAHSIRSLFCSGKRKDRKPVLLEKVPFGKRSEYLTLYVGARTGQSEKFVISKRLLAHPLFQVLMKCSEDEFGEDYTVKRGIAIICDPALFLEVVRAVDDDMWSAQNAQGEDSDEEVDV